MVEIRSLQFAYPQGSFCLEIPEFSVAAGETVAVVGPSGSGKTTLLNLIAGCETALSGWVVTNRVEISALPDSLRREHRVTKIGQVYQEFELLDYLSVLDNILLPYRICHALKLDATVRERAIALAERVGIGKKLSSGANHLSQGERQRVAVVRALVVQPPLILADEPTGNLDPVNKDRVLEILLQYAEETSATLVAVTHDHGILNQFGRVIDFTDFCPQRPSCSAGVGRAA